MMTSPPYNGCVSSLGPFSRTPPMKSKVGSEFFQNALDLGWAVARGAYKVVLTEMEVGLVN